MTLLSALKFTAIPKADVYNPTLIRRRRLVERLEEQKLLVADQSYIPVQKRWKKNPDGSKSIVDRYRRIKPWWRTDENGNVILTVKSGLRTIEFERGKAGIFVGTMEGLEDVFDTLITAVKSGEIDLLFDAPKEPQRQSVSKPKKVN